jgi:hypothetical protein
MRCPNYHLKLSSNKMESCHISATMLGITWTERWTNRFTSQVARFNPTGLFLVGLCEEHCLNDLQHLKARIRDAAAMLTPNKFHATWDEVEYRLDICCATKGAPTKIY